MSTNVLLRLSHGLASKFSVHLAKVRFLTNVALSNWEKFMLEYAGTKVTHSRNYGWSVMRLGFTVDVQAEDSGCLLCWFTLVVLDGLSEKYLMDDNHNSAPQLRFKNRCGYLCFHSISYQSFQFFQTLLSENCMLPSQKWSGKMENYHPEVFI